MIESIVTTILNKIFLTCTWLWPSEPQSRFGMSLYQPWISSKPIYKTLRRKQEEKEPCSSPPPSWRRWSRWPGKAAALPSSPSSNSELKGITFWIQQWTTLCKNASKSVDKDMICNSYNHHNHNSNLNSAWGPCEILPALLLRHVTTPTRDLEGNTINIVRILQIIIITVFSSSFALLTTPTRDLKAKTMMTIFIRHHHYCQCRVASYPSPVGTPHHL